MNFFDILRVLLFRNKNTVNLELDHEGMQSFIPYMINRWLSFSDKSKAIFVNETFNRFSALFDDKAENFKFYYNLIPKSSYKKINYIKKNKENKKEQLIEDDKLKIIAQNNCVSMREIKMYLDL